MSLKLLHIVVLWLALFLPCCLLQRRIFNGSNAKLKQFPYIVNVRTIFFTCGGALLSNRYVLTAGHCLMSLNNEFDEVLVILGAHNYYDSGEEGRLKLRSKKFWVHENFSMPYAENDLGIIELPYAVNFTDQIQPIKIMTDKNFDVNLDDKQRETLAIISGWGYQSNDYQPAEILQTARMKLIPYKECQQYQPHFVEKLTPNHICAMGYDNRPGHATMVCNGDSGSALALENTEELIGITSYIKDAENGSALNYNDCRTEIAPAVFIRVPSFLDWISEKTGMKFK